MFNKMETTLSVIYLPGVFVEHLFILSSAGDGEALEGFMQRTDLTRSVFEKDNNVGYMNVEFSLEDEICSSCLLSNPP